MEPKRKFYYKLRKHFNAKRTAGNIYFGLTLLKNFGLPRIKLEVARR